MRSTYREPLVAAPLLLRAIRKSPEEFEIAAMSYAAAPRTTAVDAGSQECLELLDHLVDCFGDPGKVYSAGAKDACIFLLEHLARRFQGKTVHDAGVPIQ